MPFRNTHSNHAPVPDQRTDHGDPTEGANLVERAQSLLASIETENGPQHHLRAAYARLRERQAGPEEPGPDRRGLDRDDGRPEALSDAEMTVKMECKICYSQMATVAILPCGKLPKEVSGKPKTAVLTLRQGTALFVSGVQLRPYRPVSQITHDL